MPTPQDPLLQETDLPTSTTPAPTDALSPVAPATTPTSPTAPTTDAATTGLLDMGTTDVGTVSSVASPSNLGSDGLIDMDAGMDSLSKITSSDSPLMEKAKTDGLQFANSRGLANSSIAAQATQSAAYDVAQPLWNTMYLAQHDLDMLNSEFAGKENLLSLEKEWDQIIQGDINATNFYSTSMEGVLDILNNKDLTPDQQANALNQYIGYTDVDGTYQPGVMSAGLDYINNLNGGTATTGTGTAPTGTDGLIDAAPAAATNPYGGNSYSWDDPANFPQGELGDVSPDGKYTYTMGLDGKGAWKEVLEPSTPRYTDTNGEPTNNPFQQYSD